MNSYGPFGNRFRPIDGGCLAANVFRPDMPGKLPVILVRTPYGKSSASQFGLGRFFAGHGYVSIVEDSRGGHDSEGIFHAMHDEINDGYDTIEWAAVQAWSDGHVGTTGGSYPPLEQDVEITGPLSVKLFAASSAPDTDWNIMLMDVYPDGYALRLNDGVDLAPGFRDRLRKGK